MDSMIEIEMKSSMTILFYFSVVISVHTTYYLLVWDHYSHHRSLVTTSQLVVVLPSFQAIKHVLSLFRVMNATDSRKNTGPDSFSLHCSRNPSP